MSVFNFSEDFPTYVYAFEFSICIQIDLNSSKLTKMFARELDRA